MRLAPAAHPAQQRQENEQGGQQPLARRDPHHRFDLNRMHGEQRRSSGSDKSPPAHPPQQPIHQNRVDRVQHQVGEMISAGPSPPQRVIDQVGEDRHRGEVFTETCVATLCRLGRMPTLHQRVIDDVPRIVPVDEVVADRRTKKECRACDDGNQRPCVRQDACRPGLPPATAAPAATCDRVPRRRGSMTGIREVQR